MGSRCKDGVVLIADRKLSGIGITGIQYQYGNKITGELRGVLTAFSGDVGAFQVFAMTLRDYVNTTRNEQIQETFQRPFTGIQGFGPSIDQMMLKVSQVQSDFYNRNEKYRCRVMMAISSQHFINGMSSLFLFEPDGRCSPIIEPKAIGSGSPYASYFLKRYWQPNETTMHQFAQLGDFVIRYVSHDERVLDNAVGLSNQNDDFQHPQIVYIPDNPDQHCPLDEANNRRIDCSPTEDESNQFRHNSTNMLDTLNNIPTPWPDS